MQRIIPFIGLLLLSACSKPKDKKAEVLYKSYCASCHNAPDVQTLPKHLWENAVLPDMAARLGIKDSTYNPYSGLSFQEYEAVLRSGIYPLEPRIDQDDWKLLKEYILKNAPKEINSKLQDKHWVALSQFQAEPLSVDNQKGTFFTYLDFNEGDKKILLGDMSGSLYGYQPESDLLERKAGYSNALIDFSKTPDRSFATSMGNMHPSQIPLGSIEMTIAKEKTVIAKELHRPVHTLVEDLNQDGTHELVVCEFGHHTGKISMLFRAEDGAYQKKVLLNRPGAVRSIANDLNGDGKLDLAVLTAQGQEGIVFLYQRDNLKFELEQKIEFDPIYGSSWFELLDYEGDGDLDIVTVHGDNADKTYIPKPYHGMRLFINEAGEYSEKFFFDLNGATRVLAEDFDQDGDVDFALLATFPNYEETHLLSFVYLENKNTQAFEFSSHFLQEAALGRWFLMDSGDIDSDGDLDIVLSSFTYSFTPVPDSLAASWRQKDVDIMVLRNKIK